MDFGSFMNESRWRGHIFNGTWIPTDTTIDVDEPATGALLTIVGAAEPVHVTQAATETTAQAAWAATPFGERAAIMRKAAGLVRKHAEELRQWIMRETGAIAPKADTELEMAAGILEKAAGMLGDPQGYVLPGDADRLSFCRRVPHGMIGVISPFNFPLILSLRAVAPALAVGNAVILKPDPQTPVSGGFIIARLFEEAGLPHGVLHVLPGGVPVGEALCTTPSIGMIAFTGSTAAGRRVGALAGANLKKTQLELGGKNALIILDDVDLDRAVSNAAWGAYLHQGQICMATGRILVHADIVDAFVHRLAQKAEHLPVGDPTTGTTALGPLINRQQRDHVHSVVTDSVAAGAVLHAGGSFDTLFYRPTVLSGVTPGMRAFDEEIFGPVAVITSFRTDDEAVALANSGDYGLSGAVIARNVARAFALGNRLETGLLHINDQTVADEPYIPFGGRRSSGNGERIGGPANWDAFTQWQWVTIKGTPPSYPF